MKLCPKCGKHFSDDANFCPVDAARLAPLDGTGAAGQADALSGRFDLGDRLGGATTGEVRRATDKQAGGKPVAVKIIAPAVMALPQVAQRIERELKQLERVESGSVARVLASGKRGESAWVIRRGSRPSSSTTPRPSRRCSRRAVRSSRSRRPS